MIENTCRILVAKFKARDHLEGQGVGWILILNCALNRIGGGGWIDIAGCCEDCNEHKDGFHVIWEFCVQAQELFALEDGLQYAVMTCWRGTVTVDITPHSNCAMLQ